MPGVKTNEVIGYKTDQSVTLGIVYGNTVEESCLLVCEATELCIYPIGSMYAIYGNMDPINIPHLC